jgi:tetratricopeptide (TPR) repeat protein
MNEKIFKKKDNPEELIRAKQLLDECKLDEADQLIQNFEETGEHTLYEMLSCHLLECELLHWRSLYEDVVKLAEQTYKESLGLGKNILSVDILLIMANALIWLEQTEKIHDIIKQGEELLKTLPQELLADYKQREAYIAFLKGWFYIWKNDADRALKHLEHSISLQEEFGTKQKIASSLGAIAWVFTFLKVDYDRALEYAERSITIAEESGNKWCIGYCIMIMSKIHLAKGDLDPGIILCEKSLTFFNDLNNKYMVGFILRPLGEAHRQRGELDRALECLEQSLAVYKEFGELMAIARIHGRLIQILIDKGDLELARQHLDEFEQINNKLKEKKVNLLYLYYKALILKTSPRARNRGKAEEILNQILEDEDSSFELILQALTNLCELLLTELRMTNDLEVLDELTQFIARLLNIAEKSHSYSILCETYLLQAKLSLLTFDIKKAQRFLTQAQQIAERFDLNLLEKKIATENEDFLKKLDLWEKLKESGAPMSDRLELARLDEKLVGIVYNRAILTPQVTEEKLAISKEIKICLVCRGEVFGFSYICKCGANYCENCAHALTNLENMCWACEETIDYSKPVKPYKEEEKAEIIEKKK